MSTTASRSTPLIGRLARAAGVLVVSLSYLCYVFRAFDRTFWESGLGDWMDPYFINGLLEHLYRSAIGLSDPSSPPMYFPVRKTLGYSHGLLLFAPFYVPLRLVLHPFVAHTVALFAVLETGIVCLYLLLRKIGLSFVESLLLTTFFFSSANVINLMVGTWSQRASVFLIPPILLMLLVSLRRRTERASLALACAAGLLAMLMYAQDFYTAHLAMFLAMFGLAAVACVEGRPWATIRACWQVQSRGSRAALAIAVGAGAWASWIVRYGGVEVYVWGLKLASHAWRRPAWLALAASALFLWLNLRQPGIRARLRTRDAWLPAVAAGAVAGAAVFVWIYMDAMREQRVFPEAHLQNSLVASDPSAWRNPLDAVRELRGYETMRPFVLVFVSGVLAWMPWFGVDRKARRYWLWFVAVSALVLLIPLRFNDASIWRALIQPLPGFGVIRDPKRIMPLYELGVVIAAALLIARLPSIAAHRLSAIGLALVLLPVGWNREPFRFERPIAVYERWVAAPMAIDPACRSFYIKGASDEYMARSDNKWTLYNVDALFMALGRGMPTLNGYSAWAPEGWGLSDPQEPGYAKHVTEWIAAHGLTGVCELDIDARVMTPRRAP